MAATVLTSAQTLGQLADRFAGSVQSFLEKVQAA